MSRSTRAKVSTIPPEAPFLDVLADYIERTIGGARLQGDPLAATRATILLPTRRACRALQDVILRQRGGRAALLPRILPLGNVDDDEGFLTDTATVGDDNAEIPPALPPITRLSLLTRLVMSARKNITPAQGVSLARDLGALLDQAHAEGLDLNCLKRLVDDKPAFAAHWQVTLDFLNILTDVWPDVLSAWDALDPADRVNRTLRELAASWSARAITDPVIAAGSTGSLPATAELLKAICQLPSGMVILPGLDQALDQPAWDAIGDTHPQAGVKRLLKVLGVTRDDVVDLTAGQTSPQRTPRANLVSEAFRPAETTSEWRRLRRGDFAGALEGLTLIEAPTHREEAAAIAVLMRATLQVDGRTAALITPDRTLARQVTAALGRWDIAIDDSAGQPLSKTPLGTYLRLSAEAFAAALSPVALLAFLEHPLASGGEAPGKFRARIRRLNRDVLRGPKPPPYLAGLREAIGQMPNGRSRRSLELWLERFCDLAAPMERLFQKPTVTLAEILETHLIFCEAMAASRIDGAAMPGGLRLWSGDAGDVGARLFADLATAAEHFPAFRPEHYPALLERLMDCQPVRPRRDTHPNLHIWGPLEARLQHADMIILGGLNEGTWPAAPDTGPWMSRPMLDMVGLSQPERRIGLSAHDVAQALHSSNVVLTRAERVEGTPAIPSRWLDRLKTVADAAGLGSDYERAITRGEDVMAWVHHLEHPEEPTPRSPQPTPRPPVSVRPRQLSVTRIETWMRDPYAIYAAYVLDLKELDPLEGEPGRADYGNLIHGILEEFVRTTGHEQAEDPESRLLEIGRKHFGNPALSPSVRGMWEPRFARLAGWVAAQEMLRRPHIARSLAEVSGQLTIKGPAGPFKLTAKADRIDIRTDNSLEIIDYKTGTVPAKKEVAAGFAPQLPLEGAIAASGGFNGIMPGSLAALTYWHLGNERAGGSEKPAGSDPDELVKDALEGLRTLIETFDDPSTPYIARPHPDHAPRFNPYQHLARTGEWSGENDEDAE